MQSQINIVWLGMGANLGDPKSQFEKVYQLLEERGIKILRQSSLYDTKPWGKTDQPDFVNQVLKVQTSLSPLRLLGALKAIERILGKTKAEKWSPRLIDIDLLFFNDQIFELPDLIIPHPLLHLREFCLDPLIELEPDLRHPLLNKTVSELREDLSYSQELR